VTSFRVTALLCLVCLGFSRIGAAQGSVGSTTLDIDPVSGFVVATCETDLDAEAEAFYRAGVECKIRDAAGKELAKEEHYDENSLGGYIQVVLIAKGVPGTTYTATASPLLQVIFDYAKPSVMGVPGERLYYDPYDFSSLENLHEKYSNLFEWTDRSRGPQVQK